MIKRIFYLFAFSYALAACNPSLNSGQEMTFSSELDSLNYLLDQNSKNSEALFARAKYYDSVDKVDSALRDINVKIGLDGDDEDFYFKGNLHFSIKEIENANNAYRQCVISNPENAKCYLQLAKVQQLLGYYNRTLSLIDSALYQNKTMAEAYFLKGFTFERRDMIGDSINAISSYQTAVELDPNFYDAYVSLGLIHSKMKDSLAIEYYNSAISLEPNRIEAIYNQAIYFQDSERFDRAMENYERIIEIDSNSFIAYYNRGYLLMVYADEFKQAKDNFDQAIEIKPDYTDAIYNRALCYKNLKNYPKSRRDCQLALAQRPNFDKAAILMSELDKLQ